VHGISPVVRVTAGGGLSSKPSGQVRVLLGSTTVGAGTLSGGNATIRLAKTIGVGTRTLAVVYSGDDRYAGSTAS
jgi:Bacterial Ig-like domain (group 3)